MTQKAFECTTDLSARTWSEWRPPFFLWVVGVSLAGFGTLFLPLFFSGRLHWNQLPFYSLAASAVFPVVKQSWRCG